ncbi:BnaA08g12910D [Brassica napus]|uniref:BnaA08g12910D protein n=1 Tax=Brassica napus TaxID=3708 RepID=A0A078G9Z6_BRANA|nr:BnaA08g12910D [Brassica napus]
MPVPDPGAGRVFIFLITLFLFLSIAVGGGCLIAYTILPYPPVWLSYLGIFFVCLPWSFWILTFAYRIVSRTFGFRMVIGSGGNNNNATGESNARDIDPPEQSLEAQDDDPEAIAHPQGQVEGNQSKKRMSTSSNSTVDSHERLTLGGFLNLTYEPRYRILAYANGSLYNDDKLKAVEVSEAILKLNQEISSDLFGEAQSWSRSESQVSQRNVVQNRYSETDDNRDWHSRAPIPSPSTVSKVKGRPTILNKMTPEKYDLLEGQLIDSGITSAAEDAHGVFCVWSQELLGHDNEAFPAEEDVEALSQLFITIGKQLDESPKSRGINDTYFVRLKELTMHPKLAPRLRFMVGNVIDLRANNWVPRLEEMKAKKITEIHSEAERNTSEALTTVVVLMLTLLAPATSLGVWLWPVHLEMEDEWFKKAVLDAVVKTVSESVLATQAAEVEACRSLV